MLLKNYQVNELQMLFLVFSHDYHVVIGGAIPPTDSKPGTVPDTKVACAVPHTVFVLVLISAHALICET